MYRAAGVEALIPHVLALFSQVPRNPNFAIYGWDASTDRVIAPRGPHPKTSAFLMTCYWLDGARPAQQRIINDRVFLYNWQLPSGGQLAFAWCSEGQTITLKRPVPAR